MTSEQQAWLDVIFDRLRVRSQPEDVGYINKAQDDVEDLIDEIESTVKEASGR